MTVGDLAADPRDAEIAELVEVMNAAEQRLEQLTGGDVDAFLTRDGRTLMLHRSQMRLRQQDAVRQAAILDALPACVAVVDSTGVILSVNEGWRQFAPENAPADPTFGVGSNYLDVCDRVGSDEEPLAASVSLGMRAVLNGEQPSYSFEYKCPGPTGERWFLMMVLSSGPLAGAVVIHFEVTDQTRARQEMQRVSSLLSAVISGTPDHVFVKDGEGRFLLVNQALARFVGCREDEMLGKTNVDLGMVARTILTAEGLAERQDIERRVMASGETLSNEDTISGATGPRVFHSTKSPYRNRRGEVIGVIVIARDVTERKDSERAMRESQALLSMAGRLALVGSWYFDVPPTRVHWSDSLAVIHDESPGFSPSFDRALTYYTPENRTTVAAEVAACIADGTPFDFEHQIQTAKGRRVWVRAIGEVVRDAGGAIVRVQGALQDVSDRKRAEHQTRRLADRLTNILGSITDAFLTLDRDWRFTFVNGEALRMLGRPSDNLIGSNIWQELPALAGTDFQRELRQAMAVATGSRFEVFYAPLKGWIGVNCYPSKTGLSIYFSDITQRRKDQDALRELNAELESRVAARTAELNLARDGAEQANRAKSAFLAAMSHEIRTPMNGVVGMIDVLEQSQLKKSQAAIVKTVRDSTYALLGIVDDVLDFSKIEAGHFHIDREPISLFDVVGQVRDTLDHLALAKRVRLVVGIDTRLPPWVLGDGQRLRQILMNLIGNAIKFSSGDDRVGEVSVRAEQTGEEEAGPQGRRCTVTFVVEDDGIGMDAATMARLFTPFMQADDSTTKRFGGTGLGLSISQRLAHLMGGTIEATSRPAGGSRFTMEITFDCVATPVAALSLPAPVPDFTDSELGAGTDSATMPMPLSAAGASESGRLILVAEDNEINQDVIRQQLALMGFTAEIAANGRIALDLWRHGNHAMLLTDLHMPVLDGYELAITIRRAEAPGRRLPIVALTANASKSEIKRCTECGIDGFMTKPLRLSDLHELLSTWMPADAQPLPLGRMRAGRGGPATASAPLEMVLNAEPAPARSSALAPAAAPASAPPPPPVDLDVLRSLVGGDATVVAEMVDSYRRSAARCRNAIRSGVGAGDCTAVADWLHPLKSAARSVGAAQLAAVVAEMEAAADSGQTGKLVAQLARFEQEYASVDRFLDAHPS